MIKFEGKVGESATRYLFKKFFLTGFVGGIIFTSLASVLTGIAFVWWKSAPVFFIASAVIVFLGILICLCCATKSNLPESVEIEGEFVSATYPSDVYRTKNIEHLKKIVDYGEFYAFKFYIPEHWPTCICQKDLI